MRQGVGIALSMWLIIFCCVAAGVVPRVDLSKALNPARTDTADPLGPPIQPLAPFMQRALTPKKPRVSWCKIDEHWDALAASIWNPQCGQQAIRLVLLGATDPCSILSRLHTGLLQHICSYVVLVEEHFCVQRERGQHVPLLQLAAYVRLVERTGLQLVAHACGDAAVRNFVNAVQLERSTAGTHATGTEKGRLTHTDS